MSSLGKWLMLAGLMIFVMGLLVVWSGSRFWPSFLGRLPGDIHIKRDNFTFYFPLATSVLISLLLTLILYLFRHK